MKQKRHKPSALAKEVRTNPVYHQRRVALKKGKGSYNRRNQKEVGFRGQ